MVNGFADAPEQNADADAGTQRDGKPAEKAEVGFCVPSAYAYAPIGEQTMPKVNNMTRKLKNTEAHPRSLTNLVLQQVHEADKGSGNAMALTINAKRIKSQWQRDGIETLSLCARA